MRMLFLILCAGAGLWSTRHDAWVVQAGVVVICVLLGTMALALLRIVRMVILGGHARTMPLANTWNLKDDGETESQQGKIEWVPIPGSTEDPLRNPWYSPDHQNPIDPDRWL